MLYYIGVTVLHMTEKQFWRSTPIKINTLSKVHADANTPRKNRVVDYVDEAGFEI